MSNMLFNFKVNDEFLLRFKDYAANRQQSVASELRRLMQEALEREEDRQAGK